MSARTFDIDIGTQLSHTRQLEVDMGPVITVRGGFRDRQTFELAVAAVSRVIASSPLKVRGPAVDIALHWVGNYRQRLRCTVSARAGTSLIAESESTRANEREAIQCAVDQLARALSARAA